MFKYISKRLLLIFPTLFGIMLINFIIIQAAPGGPVEQAIAKLKGISFQTSFSGGSDFAQGGHFDNSGGTSGETHYRGAEGLDPDLIQRIEKQYGFDRPATERFWLMLKSYITFDFGESFFRSQSVVELIKEKMPVSVSLGVWTTLIIYLISIPLGIKKALKDGSKFDFWTSFVVILGYSIPSFLFAILLIVLFAGGSFWQFFPLRGLTSEGFDLMPWYQQITDYLWHIALPVSAMVIGGFATLTMLCKNSFIDEISKQYVLTAYAKGNNDRRVLYKHIFRNAMLLVVAGFPAALVGILFTSSFLIEVIFSLDGLGLLGFESTIARDYPVMFGTLFMFTLLGLVLNLIGDITYTLIDPRIDFERR